MIARAVPIAHIGRNWSCQCFALIFSSKLAALGRIYFR